MPRRAGIIYGAFSTAFSRAIRYARPRTLRTYVRTYVCNTRENNPRESRREYEFGFVRIVTRARSYARFRRRTVSPRSESRPSHHRALVYLLVDLIRGRRFTSGRVYTFTTS